MLEFTGFNWFAILVATAIAFMLGGLWYGPIFGKAWLTAIGKTANEIKPSPAPFIISFFTALLTTIVLAVLIRSLGIDTLGGGLLLGAITGVGLIATAMASDSAFCGWGMPLLLIQAGYRVLYSIVIGGILAAWS